MTFSVIIPVFNRVPTLLCAVESVLNQTYRDFEIIVADDASSDCVYKSLKPYMGLIKYIRLDKNSGVSEARNSGIRESSGEYIAFLDSDDIWLPEKLEAQHRAFSETGLKVCHTNEFWYRKDRFVNQGKKHQRYGGDIFDKVLDICRISPSSAALHRDVFEKCGMFDSSMRVCEDYDLWLRVASRFNVIYLDDKLIIKRAVTDDQLSAGIQHIESVRLDSLIRFADSFKLSESQRASAEAEIKRKKLIVSSGIEKFSHLDS